jgi:hypothetical protein
LEVRIMNFLNGYKTYIAVAALCLYAGYRATQGQSDEAFRVFMEALGLLGIRHAIGRDSR